MRTMTMKKKTIKGILFLIIVLGLIGQIAEARIIRSEIEIGENTFFEGYNMTLLKIDEGNNKVIVCLNNKRQILSKGSPKRIDGVEIEVDRIIFESAKFEFNVRESKACADECKNNLCFNCLKDSDCKKDDQAIQGTCVSNFCRYQKIEAGVQEPENEVETPAEDQNNIVVNLTSQEQAKKPIIIIMSIIGSILVVILIIFTLTRSKK